MSNRVISFLILPLVALAASPEIKVVSPTKASPVEVLAAREVRRYFYLRTGQLLRIVHSDSVPPGNCIAVSRKDRRLAATLVAGSLSAEQYTLKTRGRTVFVVGGDDVGTLYGAYRFAERLGVRFYLHGDVVPDARIKPALPELDETGKPLFNVRGIQPFHDFPEGPDWWSKDDYLAYIAQLPKLRMNFIGFHNYPEGSVGPEPGVWIGQPGDTNQRGKVSFSYPSSWASTERNGAWGYAAMKTSEFTGGASQLFDKDEFGPEVMNGMTPSPKTAGESNRLFNNTAEMCQAAFSAARVLGIRTCIGTETPLTIPKLVQERLKQQGKDPSDRAVVRELYEGMFRRIAAMYPVDYYWLWTPENWTWKGNTPAEFEATTTDIQAALDALKAIGKPFTLATSGWVLGPRNDRAALDKFLPKDSPMSCINRKVGHAPDELGFANVIGRQKWVIPWLENDPDLAAPQPWAGRMRYDAVDALRLGCTGLLGIHWRTKILAANFAALAAAAWDQSWVPAGFDVTPISPGTAVPDPGAEGTDNEDPKRARTMPVEEFYIDFARASFGDTIADPAGKLLAGIDGASLPEPTYWEKGPGAIRIEKAPWPEVKAKYRFIEELAQLRANVSGAGNLERFDYWLNTYRYMAALAEVGCLRGELDTDMAAIEAEKEPGRKIDLAGRALSVRANLARAWEKMMSFQVAAADTPGELGTLANLEQHTRKTLNFLNAHDAALAKALGSPLTDALEPSRAYTGPARIVVPTVRTSAGNGEALKLKVILLDKEPVKTARLFWRPMGKGNFRKVPVRHVARSVYRTDLPRAGTDLEYYIQAETADGRHLLWPATAPLLNQTVISQ
jgi:hypothetical protein